MRELVMVLVWSAVQVVSNNPHNAMSEIVVNGRIKVKTFYLSFNKAYPYLHAGLRQASSDNKGVDPDGTIANARDLANYEPTKEAPISVRGNLNAGTFEKRFMESFGIKCMMHYRMNGKWKKLNAAQLKMTLNELSAALKAEGAEVIDPELLS
jgi:hypothetical protein